LKGLKKQQGFAMIASMSIVLGVVIIGSMQIAKYSAQQRVLSNSESFYNRIIYLRTQIHAFVNDRYLEGHQISGAAIFPNRLGALEPKYIPTCTTTDGDYRVVAIPKNDGSGVSHYRAEFDVKLPDKNAVALKYERQTTLAMLARVPNVFYDDANNLLTVRIDRPDKAFAYESLVKRSGDDSTLLGDWDVGGNFAVTNIKELTIRNSDASQTRVSNKLTDIYTVEHGDWLDKPSCPNGLAPDIKPVITSVDPHKDYDLTGSQRAYVLTETSDKWRLGLDVLAIHKTSGTKRFLHGGVITALIQCK